MSLISYPFLFFFFIFLLLFWITASSCPTFFLLFSRLIWFIFDLPLTAGFLCCSRAFFGATSSSSELCSYSTITLLSTGFAAWNTFVSASFRGSSFIVKPSHWVIFIQVILQPVLILQSSVRLLFQTFSSPVLDAVTM